MAKEVKKDYHFKFMFYMAGFNPVHLKGKVRIKRKNGVIFSLRDAEDYLLKQKCNLFVIKRNKPVPIRKTYAEIKAESSDIEIQIYKK